MEKHREGHSHRSAGASHGELQERCSGGSEERESHNSVYEEDGERVVAEGFEEGGCSEESARRAIEPQDKERKCEGRKGRERGVSAAQNQNSE